MIKEFAFGLSNRHHFQDADNTEQWQGIENDTFCSLYNYDEDVKSYYANNKSLSGFDGKIYIPEEFILDVDGENTLDARDKLGGLLILLKQLDVPSKVYFSGTGFHVGIHQSTFKWEAHKDLHITVKKELTEKGIFNIADPSVTDKTRIIRIVNTKNTKSGLFKVQIKDDFVDKMMNCDEEDFKSFIENYASEQKEVEPVDPVDKPVFDVTVKETIKQKEIVQVVGDTKHHTCIQKMMEGAPRGKRHMVALRLAAYLRWRFPKDIVYLIMENWRQKVSGMHPFKEEEMANIIKGCYEGHGGEGYTYGWDDPIIKFYCDSTCKLHKGRKSLRTETVMNASAMEKELIDFYARDHQPINIGALYGQDFPIYPGEVVIIQAPPASMKTMLLQNWIVALKKPTYFIEMEMSPRQIWSRFVMIENKWTHEQLEQHYSQLQNGQEDKFDYLTVDYSSPYPSDIENKISMMENKPELVVVDHMGLFKSKRQDNNMKVEEASQALMELAVKYNVVVFAVSEISKSAFKEGMDISSSRGSFRVAYNANKLLSLAPYRNKETNLIEMIHVKSDKNREKEFLNVRLNVNNVRIEK
ncbi:MAG: putative ATP-dependent helicase [Prokaryotic dsDNA virus sp.]|nr:MAG: putative ATP-dependent helicase [Prokaryotic dsDNA virus sp.]|tara:strand:+ start:6316 stop:8067 length:1752 start_codon:yes stop_codon:yes gene_type:complete